jgi:DUF1009 family protein
MKKLAIWAGEGVLPFRTALNAMKTREVVIVAFREFADIPLLKKSGARVHVISVGQMGRNFDILAREGASELVMVGKFQKRLIFGRTGIDLTGLRLMMKLSNNRDMSIFGILLSELERRGVTVVSQARYLPEAVASVGPMTRKRPSASALKDIEYGSGIARQVADYDIGQTVVVCKGTVIVVEAYEGTDAAISRTPAALGRQCVVVKSGRARQDLRFDIPSVGMQTLEAMRGRGIRTLGLQAGKTLMVERDDLVRYADRHGMCIFGF